MVLLEVSTYSEDTCDVFQWYFFQLKGILHMKTCLNNAISILLYPLYTTQNVWFSIIASTIFLDALHSFYSICKF